MKILIDMNLSPEWIQVFSKYGIDSVHWSTVGNPAASDRAIMNWAKTNSYVIFTHDLDFGAILAATQADAPSVIQVRVQDVFPGNLENLVIQVLGQFESQHETRSRVRILPITPS